jgi:flagellar basal-body rod protein FlgG
MIRGLYSATAGMLTMLVRAQTIANNLANVNTPGFREDTLRLSAFPQQLVSRLFSGPRLIGTLGTGVLNEAAGIRLTQAGLRATDHPLDLAIQGPGFFSVQTAQGVRYTRDGSFRRDGANQLVTSQGDLVLSAAGTPITLPPGAVTVLPAGEILVDGQPVAQLGVVEFGAPQLLQKAANNLLEDAGGQAQPAPAAGSVVQQGYLEGSNVDPARAMADLLATQRVYEASARMVQIQDEMVQRAVNEVGKV